MAGRGFARSICLIACFLAGSVVLALLAQGSAHTGQPAAPALSEQEWHKVTQEWERLKGRTSRGSAGSCRQVEYAGSAILVDGERVGITLAGAQAGGGGILGTLSALVHGREAADRSPEGGGEGAQRGSNSTRCHPACRKHGTCNEELARCDCPASFSGPDCSDAAMPACWLTPEYATTCAQPTTCQCTLQVGGPARTQKRPMWGPHLGEGGRYHHLPRKKGG